MILIKASGNGLIGRFVGKNLSSGVIVVRKEKILTGKIILAASQQRLATNGTNGHE